ncbi:MAG: aromatic-ring-hydroxylating dioxygenase subunit beta [Candidatus Binatia bacterium]
MSDTMTSTEKSDDLARVRASDPVYGEILDFLIDEAALLDDDRHAERLGLMTEDVTYRMPVRKSLHRRDGRGFDDRNGHFDDDRLSLELRVRRSVEIPSAYDRDPAPRIRRLVTNLVVHATGSEGEYRATSYILLLRNRFDALNYDVLSAKREDVIRRTPDGLRLASRVILVDQAILGAAYWNVFM